MISCRWPSAWALEIPRNWTSGLYVAVFTTTSGWRSFTPFVIRDDARSAALCVLLPFSTYQAYNQWPLDGRRGKSLYYGYALPDGRPRRRRPARAAPSWSTWSEPSKCPSTVRYFGDGLPNRFDYDRDFIRWLAAARRLDRRRRPVIVVRPHQRAGHDRDRRHQHE